LGGDFEKKEDELFGEDGVEKVADKGCRNLKAIGHLRPRPVYAEDVKIMRELFITDAPAATVLVRMMVGSVFLSEGIQKFLYPEDLTAGA
jgi:hypothetical protein